MYIESAVSISDQEYTYLMGSATTLSAYYAHFILGKLNRPFYTF